LKLIGNDHYEITHACLFAGAGGLSLGLNQGHARVGKAQATMRCLGGIDAWPLAVESFSKITGSKGILMDLFERDDYRMFHGEKCKETGIWLPKEPPANWKEVTPADLRAAFGEAPDIIASSPPCLPANGLVITPLGPVPISTIRAGHWVLSHTGNYRQVVQVGRHEYTGTMYGFRLNGTVDTQEFTAEHPMWVRKVARNKQVRQRHLGPAEFVPASEVKVGDRIGFPIDAEAIGTASAFVADCAPDSDNPDHARVVDLTNFANDPDLWFLLGAYAGDGYRRESRYEVIYCCGPENGRKYNEIAPRLTKLGLNFSVDRYGGETNVKIRLHAKHLSALCGAFGDGAANKRLPQQIFQIEQELLRAFLAGYRATDGSARDRRDGPRNELQAAWKIVSISLQMLRDMQRLMLRVGIFGSINVAWPGGQQEIMGRVVQTQPRWEIVVRLDAVKRSTFEFKQGAVWTRVRAVSTRQTTEEVWNLEVDKDNTFCAPMMATHNCKGLSGLLSGEKAESPKYQALNRLVIRGLALALEAFKDEPAALIVLENVPRIQTRGKDLLDEIKALLRAYGYAVNGYPHNCGELGGLGQNRDRYLLVARHTKKVRPFLYVPPKHRVRSIGEVIGSLPMPETPHLGAMHRLPRLTWQTWLRLALIDAGKDWRALNELVVQDGYLRDIGIVPLDANGVARVADLRPTEANWHADALGVRSMDDPSGAIKARSDATTGRFCIADVQMLGYKGSYQPYGVISMDVPARTITSQAAAGSGPYSFAETRKPDEARFGSAYRLQRMDEPGATPIADQKINNMGDHSGKMAVQDYDDTARTVTAVDARVGSGAQCLADPRPGENKRFGSNVYMQEWSRPARTVIGSSDVQTGAGLIADQSFMSAKHKGGDWQNGGQYGVAPWTKPSNTVAAKAKHDTGFWSVQDVRGIPGPLDRPDPVPLIIALDGTWHRPLTTLELAVLQGYPLRLWDGSPLWFAGKSDAKHREQIGNSVPPPAAAAIACEMARTLLMEVLDETFELRAANIWVQPFVAALSVPTFGEVVL